MAAGLPVVCFATRNNKSFLRENGYYAREISGQALAEAILRALEDPEAPGKGVSCRRYIRNDYSLAGIGRNLVRLYHRLCSRK
jgi:glycosyltransferase involved in cell wall biosynthesis